MNSVRLLPSLVLSAALALFFAFAARAEETKSTIKFSQPDQPGTVKVQLGRGSLQFEGAEVAEVGVRSELAPARKTPRKDGLRVLSASSSFSLTEKDNIITLDAMSDGVTSAGGNYRLTVPRNTSVIVQNAWGGDVRCSGISGDVEVSNMNGSIRLDDVSGGIVVSTMNGEIQATVRELREGKPLSFHSMNGEIVLRLPGEVKANVRIRTQNGSVLTDFDEQALVTKTESTPGHAGSLPHVVVNGHNVLTPETREKIREAARVGAEAVKEAAVAIREAAEAARIGVEEGRRSTGTALPPTPPRPPRPPKAMTIPTITGGKLVTGSLNGGGPEISIATMNGDVTIRRLEGK